MSDTIRSEAVSYRLKWLWKLARNRFIKNTNTPIDTMESIFSSVKPLNINREIFSWLCIYPCDTARERYLRILFCTVMMMIVIIVFISGVFFVVTFMATNFASTLFALVQIIGSIDLFYTLTFAYVFSNRIVGVFDEIKMIYAKCATKVFGVEISESLWILKNADDRSKRITQLCLNIAIGNFFATFAFIIISILYCLIAIGYVTQDLLFRPFKYMYVWNGWLQIIKIC